MNIIIFIVLFFITIILCFPVAFGLGVTTTLALLMTNDPIGLLPHRIWAGLDKFSWLAIPFFILAGELMGSGGILDRLLDFARLCVGRFKGGLLHVNILVSMLFGGINGSAVADTSAVGSMLIPSTIKEYEDAPFAAAVTACSSVVGPIIPPSLPFILYALMAQNVTISGMFLGGVVPGIILGLGMMLITAAVIRKKDYPKDRTSYPLSDILKILRRFILPMFLPLIMVGGVVSGIFTATESSGIAVVYAIFVGFFITKELTFKKLYDSVIHAAKVTSVVMVMVSIANISAWWLTTNGLPKILTEFLMQLTTDPKVFLVLLAAILLILGIFIDNAALIVMLVPVLAPVCEQFGINPIHAGLVMTLAIMLGLVTPPVAMSLFIAGGIAGVPIEDVFRAALPIVVMNFLVLFLVIVFPGIWMWVPELFGILN